VERRLANAQGRIQAYMALHGLEGFRLGCYEVYSADGRIDVDVLPSDSEDWVQITYLEEDV